MANLTITAASVLPGTGAIVDSTKLAGGTLTQGMPVYLSTTNTAIAARANSADTDFVYGITVSAASAGQPVAILTSGLITIGATVVQGGAYSLAYATGAGLICPFADILAQTGGVAFSTFLGLAVSTTQIFVNITVSGVTIT